MAIRKRLGLQLLLCLVILAVVAAQSALPALPERMIAIFIVDGLRPDSINSIDSPTIARLRSEGTEFVHSHSLFPTVTRLNATALVTGTYPSLNGIVGNSMFVAGVDPRAAFDTGNYLQLLKLENGNGRIVTIETLGEILMRHKRKLVTLSSGTTGVGFLLNPMARRGAGVAIHGLFDRTATAAFPAEVNTAILHRFGPAPDTSDELALMNWTDSVLRDFVLPELQPDVLIDWIGPLDSAQHATGAGSPRSRNALRQIDDSISKTIAKIESLGMADRTDIIIASDHGFALNTDGVNVTEALVQAGLKASTDSTDVVVASQGQSLLLYMERKDRIEPVVRFLQQQPWTDLIFTGGGRGDQGRVSGTFALDLIHASHRTRGADIAATLAWTSQANAFGVSGTHTITSSRNAPISTGASGHGGLNPWVVHNTFIAWGRDFRKSSRVETPVSLADVSPTILTILGVNTMATDKNHGRVLEELLSGAGRTGKGATTHRTVKAAAGSYEASLEVSTVANHDYVDSGVRKK